MNLKSFKKSLCLSGLIALSVAGLLGATGAWVNEFYFDDDPPTLLRPPDNWQNARVPSGSLFEYYTYETFVDVYDWATGEVSGRKLLWGRSAYWIPDQPFGLMLLMPDNTWKQIGIIYGPMEYYAMGSYDGDAIVMRLKAL